MARKDRYDADLASFAASSKRSRNRDLADCIYLCTYYVDCLPPRLKFLAHSEQEIKRMTTRLRIYVQCMQYNVS